MKEIFLADQCPWAGGLMRFNAVINNPQYSTGKVQYLFQDADYPWIVDGGLPRTVSNKWPEYWALCWRYPWTLSCPDVSLSHAITVLKSPTGIDLLHGYRSPKVIYKIGESDTGITDFIRAGFEKETRWMASLCQILAHQIIPARVPTEFGVRGISAFFSEMLEIPETLRPKMGLVEYFRNDPPKLWGQIPNENFWGIDKTGSRNEVWSFDSLDGVTIVPKGAALVLEIAARNLWLGVTKLGYLTDSLKLRDWRIPGLKIKILQIEFDWKPQVDPIGAQVQEYLKVRRKTLIEPPEPDLLDKIRSYWSGRPTPLSYSILGGELNPSFIEKTL